MITKVQDKIARQCKVDFRARLLGKVKLLRYRI